MPVRRGALAAFLILGLALGLAPAQASADHADGGPHRSSHTLGLSYAKVSASTLVCAKVAAKAGYSFTRTVSTSLGPQPQLVVAIAVAMAESSCNPRALNVNSGGSRDRGLWQMNSVYHPEVSDACAFQIQCNADAAWNTSKHGTNWTPWSAYTNGSWKTYVAAAKAAISGGFTFQLISSGGGTCLAADRAAGAPVRVTACDASDHYQQWTVVSSVGASPILRSLGAGTCLDWDAPNSQGACNASDAGQRVSFLGSGRMNVNGEAQALMQNSKAGTCLAADKAGSISKRACGAGDTFQMWD